MAGSTPTGASRRLASSSYKRMPPRPPRIFVADDQRDVTESLRLLLKGEGYAAETFDHPESLLGALRTRAPDAVLMDLNYTRDTTSGDEGLDTIARIRAFDAHTPIVVMTAWGTIGLAVEAMRRGAQDFIEKPWDNDRLLTVLRTQVALGQALNRTRVLEAENRELTSGAGTELIAESPVDAARARDDRARGADRRERADHGRERLRQGPRRAADPRALGPPRAQLRDREHRQPRGDGVRERDVRPREGRVHRREDRPRRPVRARRRRHAVPRRDREHPAGPAGASAARARGRRVRAPRLLAHAASRRARARGDEREHRGRDRGRPLPQRLALSAQHDPHPPAAAARARRRHRAARAVASSRATPSGIESLSAASRTRRFRRCATIPGPGTCAS